MAQRPSRPATAGQPPTHARPHTHPATRQAHLRYWSLNCRPFSCPTKPMITEGTKRPSPASAASQGVEGQQEEGQQDVRQRVEQHGRRICFWPARVATRACMLSTGCPPSQAGGWLITRSLPPPPCHAARWQHTHRTMAGTIMPCWCAARGWQHMTHRKTDQVTQPHPAIRRNVREACPSDHLAAAARRPASKPGRTHHGDQLTRPCEAASHAPTHPVPPTQPHSPSSGRVKQPPMHPHSPSPPAAATRSSHPCTHPAPLPQQRPRAADTTAPRQPHSPSSGRARVRFQRSACSARCQASVPA